MKKAFLTIKGLTVGASRTEFEYEIPVSDAEGILKMCDGHLVEKNRIIVEHEGATWEVDEFLGENAGLIIAEIELGSEDESFPRPDWLGAEVTGEVRYYNSRLAEHPYGLHVRTRSYPYPFFAGFGLSMLGLHGQIRRVCDCRE